MECRATHHFVRPGKSVRNEAAAAMRSGPEKQTSPALRSLFNLPPDFFDSGHVLHVADPSLQFDPVHSCPDEDDRRSPMDAPKDRRAQPRWTCNTCETEFECLLDQRSHFKSDLHRLNVKIRMKGKNIIKEEDFLGDDSLFEDSEISSISGSEDDSESDTRTKIPMRESKQKLIINLRSGETISLWSCLLLGASESFSHEKSSSSNEGDTQLPHATEEDVIRQLKILLSEPRDQSHLRMLLLIHGGHFAGCVFDGNEIIAHKTFHRYVVRSKAGRKQSSKDATGRAASSAGSSLRRYNESALKKEIQELLTSWKTYFASSKLILVHAPSKNYQLLFDGETPLLTCQRYIRHVPLTVRRPTLKEAKKIYNLLTQVTLIANVDRRELQLEEAHLSARNEENLGEEHKKKFPVQIAESEDKICGACADSQENASSRPEKCEGTEVSVSIVEGTPLHDAARDGDAQYVLELLEQGIDPTIKDSRGRTAYLLAKDKEIRNTFRRFMASNPDKWNWHAASVPSPLTTEMEESQAARQAEKDAKRKARAKELKKLRKAKEKNQALSASTQAAAKLENPANSNYPPGSVAISTFNSKSTLNLGSTLTKEEERKRELDIEREKRAAAAERRIAAVNATLTIRQTTEPSNQEHSRPKDSTRDSSTDTICSCCNASLAGKIPFHRYNYKYCSTTCMHVHREILEDG